MDVAYGPAPSPVKGRIAAALLVAWIALLLVGAPQLLQKVRQTQETRSAPGGGYVFTSDEGRFSAEFPSRPEPSQVGDKADEVAFAATMNRDDVVAVQYAELAEAPGEPDVYLRGFLRDVVSEMGPVRSSTMLTAYGNPAVDFAVGNGRDELLGRAVVVTDGETPRLYLLRGVSIEEPGVKAAYERLIETFSLTS